MKTLILSILSLAVVASVAKAQVPVGPGSVKLGKVQPAVVKTPEYQITGGQNKRYKIGDWLEVEVDFETKPEVIDELTFKFTLQIERNLLDGEVTYIGIPKERDQFAVVYVSPKVLKQLTGGKALTPASIENVWVEVQRQGQTLDKASFKPTAMPNLPHKTGLVLRKDQTPFAPLYYDRYNEMKVAR